MLLNQLAPRDRALLKNLFRALRELRSILEHPSVEVGEHWQQLITWTQRHSLDALIEETCELGEASRGQGCNEALDTVMHAVRGGNWSALIGFLQLLPELPLDADLLRRMRELVDEHLATMRGAISGL